MEETISHYLPEGTVLGGRYQIKKTIGEGGFGITYMGTDMRLNIIPKILE